MKLVVRGFKKTTLTEHSHTIENPVVAIGKKDRGELGLGLGRIVTVAGKPARIVPGKSGFIALPKSLRKILSAEKDQTVEVAVDGALLTIIAQPGLDTTPS